MSPRLAAMARVLGRHRSTISRELRRDRTRGVPDRPYPADCYAGTRRCHSRRTNGSIRQDDPDGTSLAGLTQRDCSRIARHLNTRPRKRLGYRTPEKCYAP